MTPTLTNETRRIGRDVNGARKAEREDGGRAETLCSVSKHRASEKALLTIFGAPRSETHQRPRSGGLRGLGMMCVPGCGLSPSKAKIKVTRRVRTHGQVQPGAISQSFPGGATQGVLHPHRNFVVVFICGHVGELQTGVSCHGGSGS